MLITTTELNRIEQTIASPQLSSVVFFDTTVTDIYDGAVDIIIPCNYNQLRAVIDGGKMAIFRVTESNSIHTQTWYLLITGINIVNAPEYLVYTNGSAYLEYWYANSATANFRLERPSS